MFTASQSGNASTSARRFQFESLERRDLMAGNVTADVFGGNLVINGDNNANSVVVSRMPNGAYEVRGQFSAGGDTRINGLASRQFTGVTGNIIANLNGGHDSIRFHGASPTAPLFAPFDLVVYGQDGNDEVSMFDVYANRDMLVNTGAGVDTFTAEHVMVGKNLYVIESSNPHYAGNWDFVNIYRNSWIGNQLQVWMNQGNDSLKVDRTTARSIYANTGAGNDAIFINQSTVSTFISLDPGMGSDNTTVQASSIGDDLIVNESSGLRSASDVDSVTIGGNQVKDYVSVVGNRGREIVRVDNTAADRLFANLGDGDDWLGIKGTTIRVSWGLYGGNGYDTLNRYGNNRAFSYNGFEYVSALYL